MKLRHIIEAQQFNKKNLQEILSIADRLKERTEKQLPLDLLRGKILGNLFYAKSMRTMLSFDSAMKRLGGAVANVESPEVFSSELAGGSFEDTVRVVGSMVDVIVLRHHRSGSARGAAEISPVPIINAGDGPAQHPTQALIRQAGLSPGRSNHHDQRQVQLRSMVPQCRRGQPEHHLRRHPE